MSTSRAMPFAPHPLEEGLCSGRGLGVPMDAYLRILLGRERQECTCIHVCVKVLAEFAPLLLMHIGFNHHDELKKRHELSPLLHL